MPLAEDGASAETRRGVGPLIPALSESQRPLRQLVFECVRASGLISRVQVAKDLGVSPATVTGAVVELLESGLIEEVSAAKDTDGTSRGRPAVMLGVRPQAYRVAGVKLSDRANSAVVMDFAGNLLSDVVVTREPRPMTSAEAVEVTLSLLDDVCTRAGIRRADLAGIGIGMPGFVDMAAGEVLWSSVLDARNVPLAQMVEAAAQVPVSVDNDANLVALAELWFGVGRGLSDFAVVTIEHGVGMGFVMNHRIYRGAQRLGMELGHTKVQLDGALCRCGQRGCLEAYVADYALAREAVTALNWVHRDGLPINLLVETLYNQAKARNATALSIFRRAGRYLAVGLSNVINLFDPALIILSGERMRYDYLYAKETLAEMDDLAIQTGRPRPPVDIHAWGDLLWAQGAAALALGELSDRLLSQSRAQAAQ